MASSQASHSQRLSQLRALAQSHLTEIEMEKAQEVAQLTQAEAEIQRYSKMSSFDRKKHTSSKLQQPSSVQTQPDGRQSPSAAEDPSTLELKKQRFRPFPEILHRLQWDPKLNINEYWVGYLERFEGIKEMPASSWVKDFSEEEWIPMHRVRYVKRVEQTSTKGEENIGPDPGIVWDRDGRIDKFSGAGERVEEDASRQQEDVLSVDGASVAGGVTI